MSEKREKREKREKPKAHSLVQKMLAPFGLLTGTPTNPHVVSFSTTAPSGLALVYSAPTPPEANLTCQILRDAGFHVEFVPSATTGVFGTTGSVHVYVHESEQEEACEFLRQLRETSTEEAEENDEM
ncbi:hypothetical protein CVU37_11925 [candidate division BRC1 bacterium HGW-BRC1-1]|jgi:hypothetical protein|nr:MAG: hypothetical protein CVU37_11925 [candidate division BRC1 bacterium HGW-BRC1-1]